MKKLFFTSLVAFALMSCGNSTSSDSTSEDSLATEISDTDFDPTPTADEETMMDFVQNLIFESEKTPWTDYDWVKAHTSEACQEFLKENYPYENEDGEGMAIWMLTGRTENDAEEAERDLLGMRMDEHNGNRVINARLIVSNPDGDITRNVYYACSMKNGEPFIESIEYSKDNNVDPEAESVH